MAQLLIFGVIVLAIYLVIRLMTSFSGWITGAAIARIGSLRPDIGASTRPGGFLTRRP